MNSTTAVLPKITIKSESLKIIFGISLLFASAQITIPIKPIPIVLTTVGVMLIGLLYQRRTALITVMAYIAAGVMGLPIFQKFSGGLAYLHGPTTGYLIGFVLAVLTMTTLRKHFSLESFWGILFNCSVGTLMIFICGVTWLSTLMGFNNAISYGVVPFIIPGVCKAIILSGAIRVIKPISKT